MDDASLTDIVLYIGAALRQARHVVVLTANEKWKDTGVVLLVDRPVTIRATGTWTFHLTAPVSANGLATEFSR